MDLSGNHADEAFRAEIRQFIAGNLPADLKKKVESGVRLHAEDSQRWHQILAKKGWGAPGWSKADGGQGWDPTKLYIFEEEQAAEKSTTLTRSDGSEMACKVMDMSLGGVSIQASEFPPIGEEVMVGKMRGRVVRHHETGFGVQFLGVPPSRGSLAQQLVSAA